METIIKERKIRGRAVLDEDDFLKLKRR